MSAAEVIAVCGCAVTAAALSVWLKGIHPEYALLISVGTAVALLLFVLKRLTPVFGFLDTLSSVAGGTDLSIVFKVIAIAFTVQISCDVCRDAGETAMASKVELAGRAAIVLTALPLFKSALNLILSVTKQ